MNRFVIAAALLMFLCIPVLADDAATVDQPARTSIGVLASTGTDTFNLRASYVFARKWKIDWAADVLYAVESARLGTGVSANINNTGIEELDGLLNFLHVDGVGVGAKWADEGIDWFAYSKFRLMEF